MERKSNFIDLIDLIEYIRGKLLAVIFVGLAFCAAGFVYSKFLVPDIYMSRIQFILPQYSNNYDANTSNILIKGIVTQSAFEKSKVERSKLSVNSRREMDSLVLTTDVTGKDREEISRFSPIFIKETQNHLNQYLNERYKHDLQLSLLGNSDITTFDKIPDGVEFSKVLAFASDVTLISKHEMRNSLIGLVIGICVTILTLVIMYIRKMI